MTLDRNSLRERLQFYRELGVGPLYWREASGDALPQLLEIVQEEMVEESLAKSRQAPKDADRDAQLRVILDDIGPNCQRCKLAKLGRKQIVFGTGDPHAELMFIGEGPGADEDAQGLPFVGRAGQLLNNMIGAMGLKREQVYIANIVKCRPPQNRKPEPDEAHTCMPFVDAFMTTVASRPWSPTIPPFSCAIPRRRKKRGRTCRWRCPRWESRRRR